MKMASAEKVKKSKIRNIVPGRRYDVNGLVRRFSRELEQGVYGDVRDVIVIARRYPVDPNSYPQIVASHFGTATREVQHWMVSTVKNRIEPA